MAGVFINMKISAFICLFAFSTIGFAELYQWKDTGGQVHYTDDPAKLPNQEKSVVQSDTPQAANTAPIMSSKEDIAARQEQNAQLAKQQQQLKARADNLAIICKRQKARIEQLKTFSRISTYKDDGSMYYLTEQEKLAYIQKETQEYQQNCSNL